MNKPQKQTQEALNNETNESLAEYLSEIQPSQMSTPLAIEKEFVPYTESFELKELGFDEDCLGYYDLDGLQISRHHWYPQNKNSSFPLPHTTNNPKISAPTFSQAFRWFREKHNLHVNKTGNNFYTSFNIVEPDMVVLSFKRYTDTENHYEEAELACLRKLIEITKEKEHVNTN